MKHIKRIGALVLAILVVFTMMPASSVEAAKKKTTYLTRAQAVEQVNKLLGATKKASNLSGIKDVKKSTKGYKALSVAVNAGLIAPDKKGKLYPTKTATYGYVADMLAKAGETTKKEVLGSTSSSKKLTKKSLTSFINKKYPNVLSKSAKKVKKGNVVINKPGVTLKNVTVKGNLIIGDGVGNKEATLDNVKVTGKTIVRGGGENSIIIKGSSSLSSIVVRSANYKLSLKVSGDANVEMIYINDGSNDVNIVGPVGTLTVAGSNMNVSLTGATVANVNVESTASNVKLSADANSTVETATVKAEGTSVELDGTKVGTLTVAETAKNVEVTSTENTKIETVNLNGDGAKLSGDGTVSDLNIKAEDTVSNVTVENTHVDESVSNAVVGETQVGTGENSTTKPDSNTDNSGKDNSSDKDNTSGGGSSGGSGGSGGSGSSGGSGGSGGSSGGSGGSGGSSGGSGGSGGSSGGSGGSGGSSGGSGGSGGSSGSGTSGTPSGTYTRDERFVSGYPKIEIVQGQGKIRVTYKLDTSKLYQGTADIYVIATAENADFDADTKSVIHGHLGEVSSDGKENIIEQNGIDFIKVTDGNEIERVYDNINSKSWSSYSVYAVIDDGQTVSAVPTLISLDNDTVSSFADTSAPMLTGVFVNKAKTALYAYFDEKMDTTSVPAANTFAVQKKNNEQWEDTGITVTGVEIVNNTGDQRGEFFNHIKLTISGASEIDFAEQNSEYRLVYTAPDTGGIQDTANIKNKTASFGTDYNSYYVHGNTITPLDPKIETVYYSTAGDYMYVIVQDSFPGYNYYSTDNIQIAVNGTVIPNDKYGTAWGFGFYEFELRNASFNGSSKPAVEVRSASGVLDLAGDAFPATLTADPSVVNTPAVVTMPATAVYDKSDRTISLIFTDPKMNTFRIAGCQFTVVIGNNEYRLRGFSEFYGDGQGNTKMTFKEETFAHFKDLLDGQAGPLIMKYTPYAMLNDGYHGFSISDSSRKPIPAKDNISLTIQD